MIKLFAKLFAVVAFMFLVIAAVINVVSDYRFASQDHYMAPPKDFPPPRTTNAPAASVSSSRALTPSLAIFYF